MTSTPSYPIQSVRPTSIGEPLSIHRHHDSDDERQKHRREGKKRKEKPPQDKDAKEGSEPTLARAQEDQDQGQFDLLA